MNIIARSRWGARPPRSRLTTTWTRRTEFVVHHTEGPTDQTPRAIQDFHMDTRGWADIGYNFLIRDDGTIYEGRGWLVIGAHAVGHNTSGIGAAYIGTNHPTAAAKAALRALYDTACAKAGRRLRPAGHGQLSGNSTSCPGPALRSWIAAGMPAGGPPAAPPWPGRILAAHHPIMQGADVLTWQSQIRRHGYSLTADGYYGPRSAAVCRAFQTRAGLPADGMVGPMTWRATFTNGTSDTTEKA